MEGRRVPVSRLATIRLITKLNNPEVEVNELDLAISRDVSLSYKLLRLINSAIFCLQRTVTSYSSCHHSAGPGTHTAMGQFDPVLHV